MRITLMLLTTMVVLTGPALGEEVRTYGTTAKTFVTFSPSNFVPTIPTATYELLQLNFDGRFITATTAATFFAPLQLPAGAAVTEMQAVFCDFSDTAFFQTLLGIQPRTTTSFLVRQGPQSTAAEVTSCVDRTVVFEPPVTIDNNDNAYSIDIKFSEGGSSLRFQSLRVGYHLQVSPSPPTATFNDVPTSHPFFQFIEALAAAGITTGCNATPLLYCPDEPLTRGQAAVFLGKALGLHFAP